jgi:transcriptional regulator with XRE-family HTH domain
VPRKPVEDWERPYLEKFGALLRHHRAAADLTYERLRLATGVSMQTFWFYEHAERRPRYSTLRRTARALAGAAPSLGSAESIAEEFIAALGPVHAPESRHEKTIEKRRDRHIGKLAKDPKAVLRPPPWEKVQLERELRLAERKLDEFQRQRRDVEAKEEELRQKEAALERLDKQIQARELEAWQRQQGWAQRSG